MRVSILFPCLLALSAVVTAAPATADEMFPFVIPSLSAPAAGSVLDMSQLNDCPAGGHGFVRVRDGHFTDGKGQRLRFLATNFTFGSCFPNHDTADHLAARLASLGINCVRFHHTDNQCAPSGIWKAGTTKKNEFDPGQLDRLDYFIAALKRHGIYSNINLHISRNYWEGADFPDGLADQNERQARLPNYGKGLDKINDQMIQMQRDYARALLCHVNPYTKTSYTKEPAVAIVEINNENTLLELNVATLPTYYQTEILQKWNRWLKSHYGTTQKLITTWGGDEPSGSNLLPAKYSIQGDSYLTATEQNGETHITLHKIPETSWHAQLQWTGLTLEEGKLYTVEFSAKSDLARRIPISTRLSHDDWHNCGLSETIDLGPSWKTYTLPFNAEAVEAHAVRFDLIFGGGPVGACAIKNLTLRKGGALGLAAGESIEKANIGIPAHTMKSRKTQDWTQFLAETERAYTNGMRTFLKQELGVESSIIDTQASYGGIAGTYRESFNDFVDMHAYWQHPSFPGRPWDMSNWHISNTPMIDDANGGNLSRLAVYRVAGKPFTVSEYDHPAPSFYVAEMFPIIASYAAVQDWDGVFQFDWGGTESNSGRITNFFALQQHPAKLAFMPAAAMMFRHGDVAPAQGNAHLSIPAEQVEAMTADKVSMQEAWKRSGLTTTTYLTHRLGTSFTHSGKLTADISERHGSQVAWDTANGLYTVNAPAAKAVVGRCTGKTTQLAAATFDVKENPHRFAVLTLNSIDGKPTQQSKRLLLTAAGHTENTGMGWNAERTSVGTQWGHAPTLCEGIAAHLSLDTICKSVSIHSLDGAGNRVTEIPCTIHNGKLDFDIGPQFKTLWYEIIAE